MPLKIGIVGTGKIARMHAAAMELTDAVELSAVASRDGKRAAAFASEFGGGSSAEGTGELVRLGIDAVYVATPTAAKEEAALTAIAAGKHVLVEKPLASEASARKLADAAAKQGVSLMDATHFTHNPRTEAIRSRSAEEVGAPLTLLSSFHADVGGRENIRFDPALEPMGCLGDLGWYALRAAVEFLPPASPAKVSAGGTFEDGALTACSALLELEDGVRTVIDCGFLAGSFIQELVLTGTRGIVSMDDFVHDWERGRIAASREDIPAGYSLRQGRVSRTDVLYRETRSDRSHVVHLLEGFAAAAADPAGARSKAAADRMIRTQGLVDAVWRALKA